MFNHNKQFEQNLIKGKLFSRLCVGPVILSYIILTSSQSEFFTWVPSYQLLYLQHL